MAKSLQLKYVLWAYILMSWSVVVYAAERDKFVTGMEAIPYEAFKYVLILVAFAGTAATLAKLTKKDAPPIRNLPLEIAKDTVGSFAAGVFAFLATSWVDAEIYKISFWFQALVIFFSGYGGSQFLASVFSDDFRPAVSNFIARALGRQMPPSDGSK